MSETINKTRTIALVAHGGAGKTSLAETLLFRTGVVNRIGRVEDGNTTMDFEPEELKRQSSISSAFCQLQWKKHAIHLIDTPGDQNFFSDTKSCMMAADTAVIVIDAIDGVKVQTELACDFAEAYNMPCMIFLNKLDRERANFETAVNDAKQTIRPKPILLQLPIGEEAGFKGVVDLINRKAFLYDDKGHASAAEIPADMQETVDAERESLIENIAEADDALIEKYLDGQEISNEEILAALKKGILTRAFAPVVCGSATANVGMDQFLDVIVNCLPSPADRGDWTATDPGGEKEIAISPDPEAPFAAFVFKTIADPYAGRLSIFRVVSGKLGSDGAFFNTHKDVRERFNQLLLITGKEQKPAGEAYPGAIVAVAKLKETTTGDTLCDDKRKVKFRFPEPIQTLISFALEAKTKGEEDKIYISLSKILEEDPSLKLERRAETAEILLSGLGQVHIEATIEKLKRKYNVEVILNTPKVPYRETIKKKVRVQGRHKKQTGGHGQFGDCWVQFEPLPRGKGFEYVDAIVGGSIPRQYIPAVEKGIVESAARGVLAGYPCVDFRATVDDGSFHAVDSSEMAFKVAGSLAFKKAIADANPVLLEPIMKVRIVTPDDFMGDIMGDLNSRRGRVLGMDNEGKYQVIHANVPLSEFQTYAPDLRSMTGGRGLFTMEFSHYDEVPAHLAEKIVEAAAKEKE